jgi:hypothetical protein
MGPLENFDSGSTLANCARVRIWILIDDPPIASGNDVGNLASEARQTGDFVSTHYSSRAENPASSRNKVFFVAAAKLSRRKCR